jgi:ParB family transcriptional regulator, chromosome partitioning protein
MPTHKMVPVQSLEEPENPMRTETIMEGMDGLVADIASNGLINPITVRDLGDGRYRVIAGHRRSIAVTILKWEQVAATVYADGESLDDSLMAAENLHRTQVNPREEAVMYRRLLAGSEHGVLGLSMRLNVPQSRIENLLSLTEGDENVLQLVGEGKLSVAQALEINRFETPVYRQMATEQAVRHGLKAEGLRRWRQDVKNGGGEQQVQDIISNLHAIAPAEVKEPMQVCQIGDHPAPLRLSKHYIICSEHWDMFLRGLEALRREEEAGSGKLGLAG